MTDTEWNKLTPRERDALVAETLWPEGPCSRPMRYSNSLLASTWPGMKLVVERMRGLGWSFSLVSTAAHWYAEWRRLSESDDPVEKMVTFEATNRSSAPAATALAAVRALEGGGND